MTRMTIRGKAVLNRFDEDNRISLSIAGVSVSNGALTAPIIKAASSLADPASKARNSKDTGSVISLGLVEADATIVETPVLDEDGDVVSHDRRIIAVHSLKRWVQDLSSIEALFA